MSLESTPADRCPFYGHLSLLFPGIFVFVSAFICECWRVGVCVRACVCASVCFPVGVVMTNLNRVGSCDMSLRFEHVRARLAFAFASP